MLSLAFSYSAFSQRPSDQGIHVTPDMSGSTEGPYDLTGTSLAVPEDINCDRPQIDDLSFIFLDNGTILIEVVFQDDLPLPHESSRTNVEVVGNTRSYNMTGPMGALRNRYTLIVPSDDLSELAVVYFDPCTDSFQDFYSTQVFCGASTNLISHPSFDSQYDEHRDNPELFGGNREFLNSLDYLTSIQRIAFYQSFMTEDCLPVPPYMIGGPIPDNYGPNIGPCFCSEVAVRRVITPGNVVGLGIGNASQGRGAMTPISNSNPATWNNDYSKGAAKWVDRHARDDKGNGNVISNIFTSTGTVRTTEISIRLFCNEGNSPSNCGCEKRVWADYSYKGFLEARAGLGRGKNPKRAEGYAVDGAFVALQKKLTNTTVPVIDPIEMTVQGVARQCAADINDEFVDGALKVVEGLVGYFLTAKTLGAIDIFSSATTSGEGASTTQIGGGLLGSVFGEAVAKPKFFDGVSDIITEPLIARTGECGTQAASHRMNNGFGFTIEPNIQTTLILGTTEDVGARGKIGFYSYGQVASAYSLAVAIPTGNGETATFCCSQQGASWIQGSYLNSPNAAGLNGGISAFLGMHNWDAADLDFSMDAGSAVKDSANPDCNDVIVDALRLEPREVFSTIILDYTGKPITTFKAGWLDYIFVPDGIYVLQDFDKNGKFIGTRKAVIFNNQIMNHE